MSVDFFNTDCKENSRTESSFGICDDQDGGRAYTSINDESNWIAKVINDRGIEISFTAIDNCIPVSKEGTNDQESTCDGMLTFADRLYLVELKNQRTGGALSQGERQLENTIKLFHKYHDLTEFRIKKAFVCNRRHPRFEGFEGVRKASFFKRTNGFRIDNQADIKIK